MILLCVSLGMAWVPWARREWSALRRGRQPTRLPDGSITPMEAARMDAYQGWFSSGGGGGDAGGGGGCGGGG